MAPLDDHLPPIRIELEPVRLGRVDAPPAATARPAAVDQPRTGCAIAIVDAFQAIAIEITDHVHIVDVRQIATITPEHTLAERKGRIRPIKLELSQVYRIAPVVMY